MPAYAARTWVPAIRTRLFKAPDGRAWLLAVQLYAVRSQRNWGHGDFTDLGRLSSISRAIWGRPASASIRCTRCSSDRPEDASPYSPNSRLFLNPLYIDVEAMPGFSSAHLDAVSRARLTGCGMRTWSTMSPSRRSNGPRCGSRTVRFGTKRGHERARSSSVSSGAWRRAGALCRVRDAAPKISERPWWEWPEEWRRPTDDSLRQLRESEPDEMGFHEFLQWIADRQLGACHALAESGDYPIGLYIDLAVGVDAGRRRCLDRAGRDAARIVGRRAARSVQPGRPGLGADHVQPARSRASRSFEPFREMLRAAMRHAGAIRIDHVLGLMRLYVIPHGSPAKDGAYLRFPFAEMLQA